MFQASTKKTQKQNIQFDENVSTQKIDLDYVFVLSLIKLSDCSIDSFQNEYSKMRFIHAVKSAHNFGRIYWEFDDVYKTLVEKIEQEYQEIINSCEPEERNILTGNTKDGTPLIDIAVSFAWKQFNALMGVATKLKPLDYEDEV